MTVATSEASAATHSADIAGILHTPKRPLGGGALFALALLSAVAPFGTDLYLAAFPTMTTDLATTATGVQLSLTAFLVGAGVGQIIFGPWSDRVGRYVPLLAGLALFLVASVLTVVAGSIEGLVIARLLQGVGGAAGMVLGRAIIIDREEGRMAARALTIMMMIGGVAPVVAPLAGSLLADAIGWRGLLADVGVLGIVALAATLLFVRESLPRDVRRARAQARRPGGWRVLLTRGYIGNLLAFGFAMAIMMSYISASPFVYQEMIGFSTVGYGVAFAVNAIGLVVFSGISARLTRRASVRALAASGVAISGLAVTLILLLTVFGAPPIWLVVPLFVSIAPLGLTLGNATTLALSAVPHTATGSASALLGLLQFVLAGSVAALVGIAGEHTTLPLAITMFVSVVIALGGLALGRGGRRGREHPPLPS